MKKFLAIVLSLALVMSSFTAAFAEATIGTEAQACADLAMLKGEGNGVTPEYLAKTPTRIQAAILFLRLKGLEAEALAFKGTDNFADAAGVKSEGNKAVMAYLKANPALGMQGVGNNNFAPEREIAAKEYYKVLLVALGYSETTTGVVGDFAWATILEDAAKLGLSKIATATKVTNNEIAIATMEALKANMKGGTTTLAAKLVADGKLAEEAAVKAGVYTKPVVAEAVVKTVEAVTNTRIDVTLENAITVAPASADFVIVDKNNAALEVKGVALSADGKTLIVTTAAQVVGGKYTVTFKTVNYTVIGQLVDTAKPEVKSIVSIANNKVKVTFEEDKFDDATLLNAANYTVDKNLKVLGAALNLDANGDEIANEVILTTDAQTSGTLYTITVKNIADLSGNVITEVSKKFSGQLADTIKPELKAAYTRDGIRLTVQFNERSLLTEATLLDLANYSVEGLTLTGIEVVKNILSDSVKEVKITTSAQTIGKLYTLTVKGVADEYGNVIETKSVKFSGSAVDTTAQEVKSAVATTNTKVKVTFDDITDEAALVPTNYTIDGLTVTAVAYDVVGGVTQKDVVVLTTSTQTAGKIYKVVVANVKDDAGNALKSGKDNASFAGRAADTAAPTISKAAATDNVTVKVTFSESLDKATATNPANYYIDGVGYAIKATHSAGVVTLTTPKQSSGKIYTIIVNGVTDLSGNAIKADSKVTFAGIGEVAGELKLEGVVAMNNQTIKLLFNGEVASVANLAGFEIKKDSAAITNDIASAGTTYASLAGQGSIAYDGTDKTVLVIRTTTKVFDTAVYTIKVPNTIAARFDAGKTLAPDTTGGTFKTMEFAGMNNELGKVTVEAIVPVDGTHYKIVFSEPVMGTALTIDLRYVDANNVTQTVTRTAANTDLSATASKEVILTLASALPEYKVVEFALAPTAVTDQFGTARVGTYVLASPTTTQYELDFASGAAAVDALQLTAVVGIDENTLDLIFNKDASYSGTVAAGDITITGKNFVVKNVVATTDTNRLRVYFTTTDMVEGTAYDLAIANVAKFVDADSVAIVADSNNYNKATFGYVKAENPVIKIAGVAPVNDNTIRVTLSENAFKAGAATSADILSATDFVVKDSTGAAITTTEAFTSTKTTIYLSVANGKFLAGSTYSVAIDDAFSFTDETTTDLAADVKTGTETGAAVEFSGQAAAYAAPTATLTTNTIVIAVPTEFTVVKYVVGASAADAATVLAGTTYTAPLADTAVTDGQHVSIAAKDAAGNIIYADYVVTEVTDGTITAVTLQ